MPKPKPAETTHIRMAVEDRAVIDHLKTQLMARSDHEVVSILAQWVMTEPTALAQLRRASPRWQAVTGEGVYVDPRKAPAGGPSEIDALLASI